MERHTIHTDRLYDEWSHAVGVYNALQSQGKHCPPEALLKAWEERKRTRKLLDDYYRKLKVHWLWRWFNVTSS